MEEQDTYRRTEIDEEKSRDRKQSGTTEGSEEQKTAKGEHTGKRGTRGKEEEDEKEKKRTKPGAIARGRRFTARCLPRGEKEKERSKVRASGPDTDRFSRSRDTDEVEEEDEEKEEEDVDEEKEEVEGREIKGSIFPPSEYPR